MRSLERSLVGLYVAAAGRFHTRAKPRTDSAGFAVERLSTRQASRSVGQHCQSARSSSRAGTSRARLKMVLRRPQVSASRTWLIQPRTLASSSAKEMAPAAPLDRWETTKVVTTSLRAGSGGFSRCVQTRQARRCSSPSPRLDGVAWTAANIAGTGLALSRGLHNSPQTPMIQIIGSPDFPDLVRPLASRLEFCAVSSYNMAGFSYLTP